MTGSGVDNFSTGEYCGVVIVVGMVGFDGGISDRLALGLEEADCGVYGVERVIEGTNYSIVR